MFDEIRNAINKILAGGITTPNGDSLISDTVDAVKTTDATVLMKTLDGVVARPEGADYMNLTASAIVNTGAAILVGMYVNSTSSGTIKFWDNTSAATTVINNTITPAVGYHTLGNAQADTGIYATIGGTLDVTIYYIPLT